MSAKNPRLKIGVVLPEDRKNEICMTLPPDRPYVWEAYSQVISLEAGQSYRIKREADFSLALYREGKPITSVVREGRIVSPSPCSVMPSHCPQVEGVIAGRNFHWRKELTQRLPGDFHFIAHEEGLLMINEVPLETYLMCVCTSEMSAKSPVSYLESQMIVARSWLLAHTEKKHDGFDACNDDCCQRYQGITHLGEVLRQVSESTFGKVVTHDGKICDTRYSKCCGGVTEESIHVWPETKEPYLASFPDSFELGTLPSLQEEKEMVAWVRQVPRCFCSPHFVPESELPQYLGKVDEPGSYFRWNQEYSAEELSFLLKTKGRLEELHEVEAIFPGPRGLSGRLKEITVHYRDENDRLKTSVFYSEYRIRQVLHPSFLYSSAFVLEEKRGSRGRLESIRLHGAGWGHGVGLCQMGALGMSLHGFPSDKILAHYFPGTQIDARWSH